MSDDAFDEEVSDPCPEGRGVTIDDFVAYLPSHVYIFTPCREVWTGVSVNARLPRVPVLTKGGQTKRDKNNNPVTMLPTTWLDRNRAAVQMTWCPGYPMLINDRLVVDGGWIERPDVLCFNHYRPPRIRPGDASKAGPWLDHLRKIYPNDADHISKWLTHRVQRPQEKINHGLVLGGPQGIGKDTLLEPVKYAVGPWNFREVIPANLLGRFNSFVKAVILRVNEGRDLGEAERVNRFTFYDHTKIYTAAPPDVLRVDEKHLREHYIFNVLGLLITTNYKSDGIYLPSDDRRHYVAWSNFTKGDFEPEYWNSIWGWYRTGGFEHVAAYLSKLNIANFDPKAPPPQTQAWWDIVSANSAPEDADLADAIDALSKPEKHSNPVPPDVLTGRQLVAAASGALAEWLSRSPRALPHRLERCGYVPVKNPEAKDGVWKIDGKRQRIYGRAELPLARRVAAAKKLAGS
jgi:hypothetical protein